MSATPHIAMVAGEASGDLLAARLLSGVNVLLPDARVHGIGGPRMQEQGFVCDWPMEHLSVRGVFEVLRHYREISRIRAQLRTSLMIDRPAVFVGVDAPDFNLGLESALKAQGIPTVHYISPSIWAWRKGRIRNIQAAVSHMLTIFPFEEEIYRQVGLPVTYVGHPLAEVLPMHPDPEQARRTLGLEGSAPVLAVLPGSRLSEIAYNTAAFIGAAERLHARIPNLQIVVPMVGARQREAYTQQLAKAGLEHVPVRLLDGASHQAIEAADIVLVASGTATLEVALLKKPMVIAYKMMGASWQILRHMGYLPWVGLPNILAREFVVPEFLQDAATPDRLAEALWHQLMDEAGRTRLRARFEAMHHSLLRDSAALSAQVVAEYAMH